MDSPEFLSQSDINVLCINVLPKAIDNGKLLSAVRAHLVATRSLKVSIDAATSELPPSDDDRIRLDLVLLLDSLASHSVEMIMFCLESQPAASTGRSLGSQKQLSVNVFTIPLASGTVPTGSNEVWTQIRRRLFALEPTASILGLAKSGNLQLPAGLEDAALSMLEAATYKLNFNIAKESMRGLLDGNAIKVEVPGLSVAQWGTLQEFFFRLQRLQALVNELEDVGALMKCKYRSADEISRNGDGAIRNMTEQGIPKERALQIRNHAAVVAVRSEGMFTALLKARGAGGRKDDSLAVVTKAVSPAASMPSTEASDKKADPPEAPEINLSAMFDLESMGCEDCASVTGPAAYFVDLLQTIAAIELPNSKTTLLQKLFSRRPDIGELQLSCANTKILIPYIDLVNEVLESVLWNLNGGGGPLIPPFDMDDYDTCESVIAQPRHVNYKVYSEILQKMVHPMNIFPYNQAVDSTRAYLSALGSSRRELLTTLQSPYIVTDNPELFSGAQNVVDRSLAAETLNLQHEDYVAICKEGFYSLGFLQASGHDLDEEKYAALIDLRITGQYWGYDDDASMISDVNGLTNIKDQLLPRSGLSFKDFLDVLQTNFINGGLVIISAQGGPEFTGELADMRLRLLNSNGTVGPLDADICSQLQAFVRLRNKLQWGIAELDAIAIPLAGVRTSSFDPQLLDGLAAVKQIADMSGHSPIELQPFWGDMSIHGPNSLYFRYFIRGPIPLAERKIFEPDENGQVLQGDEKLSDHIHTLALVLRESAASINAIISTTGLSDLLSLPNVSFLYRVSLLSSMLGISPADYTALLSLYPEKFDPFETPKKTLEFLKAVRMLLSGESEAWTLDQLMFVVKGKSGLTDSKYVIDVGRVLQVVASIFSSLKASGITSGEEEEQLSKGLSACPKPKPRTRERQIITDSLKPQVKEVDDSAIMQFTLSEIIRVSDQTLQRGDELKSGMDILLALTDLIDLPDEDFDGYFLPPKTDIFIISIETDSDDPPDDLILNGERVSFGQVEDSSAPIRWEAITSPLIQGRSYQLLFAGNVKDLRWTTQQTVGAPLNVFAHEILVPQEVVSNVTIVLSKLFQVMDVVSSFKLEISEVAFWQSKNVYDFNALSFENVRSLKSYSSLKYIFSEKKAAQPLLALYQWLHNPKSRSSSLSGLLSAVAARPRRIVQYFLQAKYPSYEESCSDLLDIFKDVGALSQMQECFQLVDKLGLPSVSLGSFFGLAKPALPPTVGQDFDNAAALRLGLQSTFSGASTGDVKNVLAVANDQIRSNSRNALVQCLLLQDYAKENKLNDPETLFAHFLIDVQMGPVQQTSRIKQATSTVQLFVQRCMLGAEKENGITGSLLLDRTDWEYVMQYRLWEANRKAFLYPENWIDPTLRESKSEQFMAVEAAISQANLDSNSIRDAIEGYVRSTNEVADLQIETYLWERQNKNDINNYNSTFHIFGRTRTNPPSYYYRQVELSGSFVTVIAYWTPWRRMNIELPVHEGDSEGKKLSQPGSYVFPAKHGGRLFVFIPEVLLGEQPKDEDANKNLTFEEFSKKKINQTEPDLQWEIQLGFTEYLNGGWSPRQVSTSTILIRPDAKGKKLPDVSGLKFWVHTRTLAPSNTEVIAVRVELGKPASDGGQGAHPLGEFQLRGQHLLLIGGDNLPVSTYHVNLPSVGATLQTAFTKFQWPVPAGKPNEAAKSQIWNGSRLAKPLLGTLVQNPDSKTLYKWALSLDMINNPIPTGFIFDVSSVNSTETYFAFPPQNPNPTNPVETLYIYETFYNRVSPRLVNTINAGAGLQKLYTELSELPKELYWDAFGQRNSQIFHEKSTPFAIYNWELGVHLPSLLMERLMATQQYDLALDVARLVFDPSADGETVDRCWSFPPFRDEQIRTGKGPAFDLEWKKKMTADEWRANKFSVHAAARGNPVSYMKRIATKYIEILIAAGDHYFRQDTLESVPLALQRYIEASQAFGPAPVEVPVLGKRAVKSYNQIAEHLNIFSNAVVNMELEFPFYSEPGQRGTSSMEGQKPLGFIKTEYFCVPGNPYLVNLRTLIDDRLYKIRNGLDIDGRQRTLALYEPPIDPEVVVRANAARAMAGLAVPASDPEAPGPKYRFQYLLGRAYELAHELKSTESKLLMVKEKKDAEALAALQREHRKAILKMARSVEESRKSEWEKRIEIMEWERKGLEMRLRYFLDLTGDDKDIPQPGESWQDIAQVIEAPTSDEFRMSPYEKEEIDKLTASISLTAAAQGLKAVAQILSALPTASVEFEPLGVGGSLSYGGNLIAAPFVLGADILEISARRDEGESRIASSRGYAMGRLQGRRMDANMVGRSIVKLDKDIELLRLSLATQGLVIEQRQLEIEQVEAEEQWMQDKYSTQELYAMFENSLGILLYQTYVMGKEMAMKVKEALEFESATRYSRAKIAQRSVNFLDRAVQNGHMMGEALFLDLKQLEAIDIEEEPSNLVISKTVSLRQLDPWALIQLRETGTAQFKLSEALFDMDFPGHYFRRIVSVGLSIPCEAGPYTSLNCTLSLHSHKYRMSPLTRDADSYNDAADHGKDKKAFRTNRIPISSVAVGTSAGAGASTRRGEQLGSFELDFPMSGGAGNSNKYGPFESAGAISDWQIRLPSSIRAFDYDTISDVLLHIKYTSLDGGDRFRQTVESALFNRLSKAEGTSSVVAIDLSNEYAAQWNKCMSSDSTSATLLDLPKISNMLPYWTRRGKVKAESVALLATLPKTETALAGVELQTGRFTVEMAKNGALSVGEYEALVTQGAIGDVTDEWKINGLGGRSTISRAWLLIRFSVTGFK